MVRTCSECDAVLLPDVWTQYSHNAVNKCLKCKRKGGFKKAVGLGRELKDIACRPIEMRTITVLFPCELCEIKGKNLKYCVRHGHDERKVFVQEPDEAGRGDETMDHHDYEKVRARHACERISSKPPKRSDRLDLVRSILTCVSFPGHGEPIFSRAHSVDDEVAGDQVSTNNKSRHDHHEVPTIVLEPPQYDDSDGEEAREAVGDLLEHMEADTRHKRGNLNRGATMQALR